MPTKTYRDAINEALRLELERDPTVVVIGEDIVGGAGGTSGAEEASGGAFGVHAGLVQQFGRERIIDTSITESAIVGAGAGAALTGLRPVVEIMFVDFMGVCLDQILNQIAKFRYMFGGKTRAPVTIRTTIGAGFGAGPQHSQALYAMFTAIPGLKCVLPSNPYDAKGLLIQAIRDDDPVVVFEHKMMYADEGDVPDEDYVIPFGEANFTRSGDDVTIVAFSRMVHLANQVADQLAKEGVSVEVIDPRTTSPLDEDSILDSVDKTGRLVVVDEANPMCGMASEIAGLVACEAFDFLNAPVVKVTAPHTPVPATPALEQAYLPSASQIETAVRTVLDYD